MEMNFIKHLLEQAFQAGRDFENDSFTREKWQDRSPNFEEWYRSLKSQNDLAEMATNNDKLKEFIKKLSQQ